MSRSDQMKAERRRRNSDALGGKRRKLSVSKQELDTDNFEYRWINDVGSRVYDLTVNDDWDVVSDRDAKVKTDGSGAGSEVAVRAGTQDNGNAVRSILVRKPKAFANDDKAAKQRRIDETEASLKQGNSPGGNSDGQYVPDGKDAALTTG